MLGLQQMDKDKKLHFLTADGDHLQFSDEFFDEQILPFLKWKKKNQPLLQKLDSVNATTVFNIVKPQMTEFPKGLVLWLSLWK